MRSFFAFPSDSLWYPEAEYGIMATTYSETAHLKGELTYGTHQSGLRRNGRRAGRSVEGIFLLRSHFCGCSGSQGAEFVYDASTEPSVFAGSLGKSIGRVFKNIGKRFTFGGEAPKDQRIYYINTKEITGNKYGTASPVPFRVVDQRAGIDMDVGIRCFGEYSYHIANPLLFYTNVCGNVTEDYKRAQLDSQLKTELLTALQPAFAKVSELGVRYSALPGHAMELADSLNQILSAKWRELRGIEIVSCGVSSVTANEEDEKTIKELQRTAAFIDPARGAAHLVAAQGDAMKTAAGNANAGPAMAFMGMNMAGQAGGANAQTLYQMGQQAPAQPAPSSAPAGSWKCACGAENTGKFCVECGKPKPEAAWKCPQCGAENLGKFCSECGTKKPAGVYQCSNCGWKPAEPAHLPKFCPECGNPFNEMDLK